jgi:hypothetical protein
MLRIRRNKPAISRRVRPNRELRRLNANPTFVRIPAGEALDHICLASLSAMTAMSGFTLGVALRIMGL